jgi:nucleoside-diphosphate-sugar epimerase
MNKKYVVVGAGPVGRHTAEVLRDRGDDVIVVTRSGRASIDGVESVAADASSADALSGISTGAAALFNCANPSDYTKWEEIWPPLAESLLAAAEHTGATLVTSSCLYPYGPTTAPMVEGQPDAATDHKGRLRAGMWAEAKTSHDEGRIRAVEVRGADYIGAGVGGNGHITRHLPTAIQGKTAWVIGKPDLPHTWTDVLDMARTLAAVADLPKTWGQVWHAPSNEPRSQREALTDVLEAGRFDPVPVRAIPMPALRALALVDPLMREIAELSYMWTRPYVLSSTHTQETLRLAPTPWDEVCRRTAGGGMADSLPAARRAGVS